jgi:hypothetical protein
MLKSDAFRGRAGEERVRISRETYVNGRRAKVGDVLTVSSALAKYLKNIGKAEEIKKELEDLDTRPECVQCGTRYDRKSAAQKYCSVECRIEANS